QRQTIRGLKIRSREKRGMGSNPIIGTSKIVIIIGRFVRLCDSSVREWPRMKTHRNTLYSSSIWQARSALLQRQAVYRSARELAHVVLARRSKINSSERRH